MPYPHPTELSERLSPGSGERGWSDRPATKRCLQLLDKLFKIALIEETGHMHILRERIAQ
jgi:hypothetical protein